MSTPKFYNIIRKEMFNNRLSQDQVNGIEAVLEATNSIYLPARAYILATVYHETAKKMYPLSEYGKGYDRAYGQWKTNSKGVKYCFTSGSKKVVYTYDECPHLFYGRGYVQLTWKANYEKADFELKKRGLLSKNKSLVQDPELANNPEIAAHIMVLGMKYGWFTGKSLDDYFTNKRKDYRNARRIINGMDCADMIAKYAIIFEKALSV